MKTSEIEKAKEGKKKPESLVFSKQNLLQLIEGKKMKTARGYIEELKNSNPKAEKYIREVLEEIFCQKKVSSASVYMYGLVFYKNLLISGELDYYEDTQFFPLSIHEAIASICQFNEKQTNIKSKGTDYFKVCVKISPNEKVKEDIQTMGIAVVIYATELLQSMAEWYKEDYFTGEESHFRKKYKSYLKRGIIFPKKQDYVYIKDQDRIQFEKNYQELFQENVDEDVSKPQQTKHFDPHKNESKAFKQNDNSKLLQMSNLESIDIKKSSKKQQFSGPQKAGNLNLTELKTSLPISSIKNSDQSIKPNQSLKHNDQQRKINQQTKFHLKDNQAKSDESGAKKIELQASTGRKTEVQQKQKSIEKDKKNFDRNESLDLPQQLKQTSKVVYKGPQQSRQPLSQNNKHTGLNSTKLLIQKQSSTQEFVKNLKESRISQENKQKISQGPQTTRKKPEVSKVPENAFSKKYNSPIQISHSPKRSFKRTEQASQKTPNQISFPSNNKEKSFLTQQPIPTNNSRTQIIEKRKHKIFQKVSQTVNSSNLNHIVEKNPQNGQNISNFNQLSDGMKINILNSNVSFSPVIKTDKKYDSVIESPVQKKRSVPKTEKKYLERTFAENEDLLLKLNLAQNFMNLPQGKTSSQKFPMKTLSAWRCQKQIKRDFSPQNKMNHHSLMEVVNRLKFKQMAIPFVPEYFEPITLKMFGLRKSALDIAGSSETSQVFFNNKIISARLMKPGRNSYILSILNVSRIPLHISLADMKKSSHSNQIKIAENGLTPDSKTVLNNGCYIDIHFSFSTNDLNFKFLIFDLWIDDMILPLQLPISLLDQCKVENGIQVDNILSYRKAFAKIIKSEPFKMNKKEIPNFMKNENEVPEKNRKHSSRYEDTLSCYIIPDRKFSDTYRLEIIYDSACQQNQAFAKVMVELLIFLLWE